MQNKIYPWLSMTLTNTVDLKAYFQPFFKLLNHRWSSDSYLAKVQRIKSEDNQTYTLTLKPSFSWQSFKAGQYIQLTVEIEGSLLSRTFSISSAPSLYQEKKLIEITIQKQARGRVTPVIQDILKPGQYVNISAAKGDFIAADNMDSMLLIAGGSGITPIKSLITQKMCNLDCQIKLIYYAKNDDHLFRQYLSDLESTHSNLDINFINTNIDSRINLQQLKSFSSDYASSEIFICGPSSLIQATEKLLLNDGVNPEKIHFEYFGASPINNYDIDNAGEVTFQQSAIKTDTATMKNKTLLDVAETTGISASSGCRMGVCHQCVCKKKQGVIYNTLTKVFSDTGAEDIQLCISIPVGDVVLEL